jgi:dihydroorotase
MPNTQPPLDTPQTVETLKKIIDRDAAVNVFVAGAISRFREGKELCDIEALKKSGVIALSDDGSCVTDNSLMEKALKSADRYGLLVTDHCEDKNLSARGMVNEGFIATRLGLRGWKKEAEYKMVKRDIDLAEKTGTGVHISHVSCGESLELIRRAKEKNIKVTCEVAPHYFTLSEDCCVTFDTNTKVNPPLRGAEDIEAIKKSIKDKTVDAIASDHAPHGKHDKEVEFEFASSGIIGLETSLALCVSGLIETGIISWAELADLTAWSPARILGLKAKGAIAEGFDADIALIDPDREWVYKEEHIKSKSKNSPFVDWKFKGMVTETIAGGKILLREGIFKV